MPFSLRVAEQLEDLDAEDDRTDDPAGDPEEESDERVLGDEEQENAQLDRPDPPLRQVDEGADDCRGSP